MLSVIDYRSNLRAYKPGLHRLAILTFLATFPLIFIGGLVTTNGAGLSVPDWPNSYGYNMFTFPYSKWVGGIWYEHVHRLCGTAVGMLSIALLIWALYAEPRKWVRWLAGGVLMGVIIQGVLGGLRVIWVNLDLAIVHACVAQAFLCLLIIMIAATSRWWMECHVTATNYKPQTTISSLPTTNYQLPTSLFRLALLAALLIYLQTIAGAVMRHYRAGLAIPDLPLAFGHILPPTNADQLAAANKWILDHPDLKLPSVTMAQVWIHFAHRVGAILATIAVALLIRRISKKHADQPLLMRPAWLLTLLIFAQLTLGVLVVLWQKPADITSYHVAVGALLLATTFMIGVRALRIGAIAPIPPAPAPAPRASGFPSARLTST